MLPIDNFSGDAIFNSLASVKRVRLAADFLEQSKAFVGGYSNDLVMVDFEKKGSHVVFVAEKQKTRRVFCVRRLQTDLRVIHSLCSSIQVCLGK